MCIRWPHGKHCRESQAGGRHRAVCAAPSGSGRSRRTWRRCGAIWNRGLARPSRGRARPASSGSAKRRLTAGWRPARSRSCSRRAVGARCRASSSSSFARRSTSCWRRAPPASALRGARRRREAAEATWRRCRPARDGGSQRLPAATAPRSGAAMPTTRSSPIASTSRWSKRRGSRSSGSPTRAIFDPRYAERWRALLARRSRRSHARSRPTPRRPADLRQNSPFAGVLNEQERRRIIETTR